MGTQDLSGRVTLITNTSYDIGAAIVDTLAAAGAKVTDTAASENGVAAINERLAQWGGEGHALNSAEPETIENLIADIGKEFGKLDILVNNAGITRDNLLMRTKEEEWDNIMQVNLKSVLRTPKAVLHGMMKQHAGRIIDITSIVGVMGNAGQTSYAAAKTGLIGFSKSMAHEVGSHGITVNCVAPSFIDADMTRTLPEEARKTFETQASLGKFGRTRDVADAVLFLASDQAKCITDQTLHVNSGMLIS